MDLEPNAQHIRMPSFVPKTVNGDAAPSSEAMEDGQSLPAAIAPPSSAGTASPHERTASAAFLPDLSPYDLTVGEALDVFSRERRKRPSDRTLQRYCQDGRFDCYKLKTTRNGNPVHEWIINSASLLKFIHTKPAEESPATVATPISDGDANEHTNLKKAEANTADAATTPVLTSDAEPDLALPRSSAVEPTATATPTENDDASFGAVSRVELLIENAKMTARLDAQNELIGELREDKKFMREQIVHNRQNDTLMSDMHRETLQTLKAVSVAGRHTKIEMPSGHGDGAPLNPMRDVNRGEVDATKSDPDGV